MSGGITAGTGMAIMGGALLGGAILSSQASKGAAQTQADAANNATAANNAALQQQAEMNAPWRTAGTTAVNQLSAMTQPGGELTKNFTSADFAAGVDPGYAFRISEGNKALNAAAAARGGLISGNALKAATNYGQAAGSQEYSNAFNRYQVNRANLLDPLKFLSGQGQASAANQASNIGANTAANAALTTGAANASAAGQVGAANAYSNAIGQGIGAYQMNNLINKTAYGNPNLALNYGYGGGTSTPANIYDYSTPYSG
jgi:hypothetical protein